MANCHITIAEVLIKAAKHYQAKVLADIDRGNPRARIQVSGVDFNEASYHHL